MMFEEAAREWHCCPTFALGQRTPGYVFHEGEEQWLSTSGS